MVLRGIKPNAYRLYPEAFINIINTIRGMPEGTYLAKIKLLYLESYSSGTIDIGGTQVCEVYLFNENNSIRMIPVDTDEVDLVKEYKLNVENPNWTLIKTTAWLTYPKILATTLVAIHLTRSLIKAKECIALIALIILATITYTISTNNVSTQIDYALKKIPNTTKTPNPTKRNNSDIWDKKNNRNK